MVVFDVSRPDLVASMIAAAIRGPLLATLLAYALYPYWLALVDLSDRYGVPQPVFFVALTLGIREVLAAAFWLFFLVIEHYGWLQEYRLRPNGPPISGPLRQRTFWHVLKEHAFVQPLCNMVVYYLFARNVAASPRAPLLPFVSLFLDLAFKNIFADVYFYATHWFVHRPSVYKYHAIHHEYHELRFIAADYAHGIETYTYVVMPTFLYCVGGTDHQLVWVVFSAWHTWQNYELHSSYSFADSWLGKIGLLHGVASRFHLYHHQTNKGFGLTMLTDWALGTLGDFLKEDKPIDVTLRRQEIAGVRLAAKNR